MKPVGISLVGVANFARSHEKTIRRMVREGLALFRSVLIRNPGKYPEDVERFRSEGITVYESYEEMLEEEQGRTEIIALPTSIHTHSVMTIEALEAGYNVIVEKPPAPTIQELDAMIQAERNSVGFCVVGFQNQSKNTVRAIKEAVCDGKLGRIKEVVVKARWARLDSYYARNDWAGRLTCEGRYVLDGPTNNALSHYLNNALYYASPEWGEFAKPVRVKAELYRGHRNIETEDTCCAHLELETGTHVYFFVTHCPKTDVGPVTEVIGTKGKATWSMNGPAVMRYIDGTAETVPYDRRSEHDEVFRNAIKYLRNEYYELNCPLEATRPFVLAVNGIFESADEILPVPDEYVELLPFQDSIKTVIKGIDAIIDRSYAQRKLFSELDVPWAKESDWFDLTGYTRFEKKFG
ncbi:TPA: Gfo/Idh/MocA family oxidoreductase [Candidatus Poribacteria bacterium]|nr:Gfo/Idh/MocA family oxidoreductase [Candidatus Poribacteria bacterium]HEX30156.1 Gfo/Idh/MocA family oxidoreductase [Candidatus Poribacteria bacterium]